MQRVALLTAEDVGEIALDELTQRKISFARPSIIRIRNQDLVVVSVERKAIAGLFGLRVIEDIFAVLEEGVSLPDERKLHRLTPRTLRERTIEALPLSRRRRGKKASTTFWVFVKQDEDHDVWRRSIAEQLVGFYSGTFARWTAREPAEVEVWAFLSEGRALVGLRLTDATFRQRRYKRDERPGSLRPTLAAAVLLAAQPGEEEVVLDPMCGVGTLLLEYGIAHPDARLIGGDRDRHALALAKANAERAGVTVSFHHGDATTGEMFPGLEGEVSLIVCNLPFGKQFGAHQDLMVLYRRALQRWRSLLQPGGRMVLLTSRPNLIHQVAGRLGLVARDKYSFMVQGIRAGVVTVAPVGAFGADED
jgi:SAM-dependent methyltransferase